MNKRRVLFVDDEPKILAALNRMLYSMRREWDTVFASSGSEALEIMDREPFDVIVTDMRMPGMDGAALLNEVMRRHPKVIRVVLSGQADKEAIFRAIGPIHIYLSKPCDAEVLKSTLARACMLSSLLADEDLRQLVSRMETLPSLPALYHEILRELQSPEVSAKSVGRIIAQDIGMTAKVLQLVNSAFFGLPQHVSNPVQAVVLLGLETIKILVLSTHIFSQFEETRLKELPIHSLWRHSVAVGTLARQIARAENADQKMIDHAAMAGLLHDVGKLVLAANLPGEYSQAFALAAQEGLELQEAERRVFGSSHAEVGAYLLGLWGLPDSIVMATAFHHRPALCPDKNSSPLAAVHVANVWEHEARPVGEVGLAPAIDHAYLAEQGLAERLPVWRDLCEATLQEEGA